MSRSGRRPHICARVPTHGDSAATSICGTTMQAAINTVAQWLLERMVSTLPINGSMAALARWNSKQAAGKDEQRPIAHQLAGFGPRLFRRLGGGEPWARSGSISAGEIMRSANSAGPSNNTVTMKTARAETK